MTLSKFNNVKISSIVCVVPENKIDIDDEIKFYENSSKKLARNKKILGLGTRHVVPDGVSTSDLCEEAAKILINETNINIDEIDTLIMTSINHDYNGNSDACIIQGNLGLSEECACFDTCGLGCTDSIYGLWLAHSLIQSGASKKCLFLEGSLSSRITDIRNRNSNMLFGDAGAAILLERTEEVRPAFFHLKSIGKDWKKIVTPAGGFKFPVRDDITDIEITDPDGNILHLWDSIMSGGDIFKFAMEQAPDTVEKVLNFANKTRDDIDFFAIHQANSQIVRTVIMHAGLPKEKASAETFSKYGNCGGTSVLVNFCDQMYKKQSKSIAFVSFGVGLSVGSAILNFENAENLGVRFFKTPQNVKTRKDLIEEWTNYIKGE